MNDLLTILRGGNYKGRENECDSTGQNRMECKNGYKPGMSYEQKTTGWRPTCACYADRGASAKPLTVPCTVLDPFGGSGTTGAVALELGRRAILCELNPDYVEQARSRCNVTPGLALA